MRSATEPISKDKSSHANWNTWFGLDGCKHGTIFARSGHKVVFSYSHSKQKLKQLVRQAGNNARSSAPREAAQAADLLVSQPTRFGYADYCRLVTEARTRNGGMR